MDGWMYGRIPPGNSPLMSTTHPKTTPLPPPPISTPTPYFRHQSHTSPEWFFRALRRPKRRITSPAVTKMEMLMRMMIIQVIPIPGGSAEGDNNIGGRKCTRHVAIRDGVRQDICQV